MSSRLKWLLMFTGDGGGGEGGGAEEEPPAKYKPEIAVSTGAAGPQHDSIQKDTVDRM